MGPKDWTKTDTPTNIDLVPPIFCNRHKINEVHSHTAFIFAATAETREVNPQTEEDKGVECRWVTGEELALLKENDSRLRPEIYRYAMTALMLAGQVD